jgi:transposase InsO family protein
LGARTGRATRGASLRRPVTAREHGPGPQLTISAPREFAVVEYLGWFNHTRLHESLGDLPPAEFEAEAPRAQAAPKASEGPAIDGRPLRSPVPSEILIS